MQRSFVLSHECVPRGTLNPPLYNGGIEAFLCDFSVLVFLLDSPSGNFSADTLILAKMWSDS